MVSQKKPVNSKKVVNDNMNIPLGFKELVSKKIEIGRLPKPIQNDDEMWAKFCWAVFLGNKTEYEINYVLEILNTEDLMDMDKFKYGYPWPKEASAVLNDAKNNVDEHIKIGAIKKIEGELIDIDTTLKSAYEIFFEMRIPRVDANYINRIYRNKDSNEENELITDLASKDENQWLHAGNKHQYKIPGVAYTKTILWMHGCGIGLNYIPDNSHSIRFLKECGDPMTNPDFFVINHKFKLICNYIGTGVFFSGWALWLYEATKNLMNGNKAKQNYKPIKLLKIMEQQDMTVHDVADKLTDIDEVGELEEILNRGIKTV